MRKRKHRPPKEVICPHCLEPFPLWDMRFRDRIRDDTGKTYPAYRPWLAEWRRQCPRYAKGPNGEKLKLSLYKVCPNCGELLPYTAGEQKDLLIGLVGTQYSGKSHFVATLLYRLETRVGTDFNAALTHMDSATLIRRKDEFQKRLSMRIELDETDPHAPPLLYNFSIIEDGGGNRSATLALYDTAGENFNTGNDVIQNTPYLLCASGLIFLLDPLQMVAVRQMLPRGVKLPDSGRGRMAPQQILSRVIHELRRQGLVDDGKRLATPVAFALTKCDVLRDNGLIDPHRLWSQEIHHVGCYNLSLHDDVNGMFSEYMQQWDPGAWAIIRTHFANFAFFGVSATGCSSDEMGRYPRIAPWRVEDPLLWLLYQHGIIPGCEER